ncbi:synergin gamma-like isoform X2 [Neocloeon triangulifer]|uniref:synergin gamma-like isoform X2 n=1 Tax=Neocloeon triangulifer TaxID=2078957 RepID=UPI00286EB725|nr:synergin gamma-like isoform X2 [Neocloeon triangulifer]
MDNRFPSQGSRPHGPHGASAEPFTFGAQPLAQGWTPPMMNLGVPSVSASVAAPVRLMHQQPPAAQHPPSKDRNYLAQQQKLRAMASSSKKKPVSADSLIDDLLQKKETFTIKPQVSSAQAAKLAEKQSPVQLQGMAGFGSPPSSSLPLWLQPEAADLLPAVYRQVWDLSKSSDLMVDTGRIFAVLVTSGLPRDSLGYIWNLANTRIPGVLDRHELNVALALVALAQTGWRDFGSTAVLALVQQPPIPLLQLEAFNKPQPAVQPAPQPPLQDIFTTAKVAAVKQDVVPTISQQVSSAVLLDDDFSDFQAAPPPSVLADPSPVHKPRSALSPRDSPVGFNSFESPPTSPAFCAPKGKGSREVGSRLANYSFTATSSSSGSRKSETDNEEDVFKADDLFPKCVLKDKQPDDAPPFLKDTAIRSEPDESKFEPFQAAPHNKKEDDKYSALRDLDFGGLSLDPPAPPAASQEDFGDFLSADVSLAPPPNQSAAPNLADFGFSPEQNSAKDWNASFEAFTEKSSVIDEEFWRSDPVLDPSAEEDDFGDFVGPSSSLPPTPKMKDIPADAQSVASLELGGFDSLSFGGAGPSSSPALLDLKIAPDLSWESQPNAQQDEGAEWKQCLHSCTSLLQAAAQIFLAIDDPSVVEEVVTSKQGEDYLANLLEVYCVTQRINAASRKLLPSSRHALEPLLGEVDAVWNTLRPFLEQSSLEVKDPHWNFASEKTNGCSLCLAQVEVGGVGSLALVRSGANSYHAACANLWLNCINAQLPAISVP